MKDPKATQQMEKQGFDLCGLVDIHAYVICFKWGSFLAKTEIIIEF